MEKQVEEKGLQLEDLKVSNLPELKGWKEKQEQLVKDNPYVEIVDNKTYTAACQNRTALLKGRTELEKQDKLIASKVASFRKEVKTETDILIAITQPSEEKQQAEVKRYETIKAEAKAEEERIEAERIEKIKSKIDEFETKSYGLIATITFLNVEKVGDEINLIANEDFDYEEYDILFENAKARIQIQYDAKFLDVKEKEEQRLENERLEKENAEAKRLSELQAFRLNEILPYVAFGEEEVDLTKLSNIEESDYARILDAKIKLFQADAKEKKEAQDQLDAENLEKENKAEADKEKIFEIRRGRLAEIGMARGFDKFINADDVLEIPIELVKNADAIQFEEILNNAKKAIEKAKAEHEEAEKQKSKDLQLSKEDAERLKKENKARIKTFAADKKLLIELVESLDFHNALPEMQNDLSEEMLNKLIIDLDELKKGWLNNVNNI